MAFPSLRNYPLSIQWARIWSYADITVELLSILILIIHFIFQQEAMILFLALLSIWYLGLLCITHKHLFRLTQFRVLILAHSKNLKSFINIVTLIYLSARAFKGSKDIKSSILYFMFVYILFAIYNIIAWVTSFMLLGSAESEQPFKQNLFIDYYPILNSKGRTFKTSEYSPESDWVQTRGINQQLLKDGKKMPMITKKESQTQSLVSQTAELDKLSQLLTPI